LFRRYGILSSHELNLLLVGRWATEQLSDLPGEDAFGQRLWNKFDPGIQSTLMNDRVSRVAGHKDDFRSWPPPFDFIGEFTTVLAGKDNIGKQ
jgi:hypothetical protein